MHVKASTYAPLQISDDSIPVRFVGYGFQSNSTIYAEFLQGESRELFACYTESLLSILCLYPRGNGYILERKELVVSVALYLYPHPIYSPPIEFSETYYKIKELGLALGTYSIYAERAAVGPFSASPNLGYLPYLSVVNVYIHGEFFSPNFQHYCRVQLHPEELAFGKKEFLEKNFYSQPNRGVYINMTTIYCVVTTFANVEEGGNEETRRGQLILCSGRETCVENAQATRYGSAVRVPVIAEFKMYSRPRINPTLSTSAFLLSSDTGETWTEKKVRKRVEEPVRVKVVLDQGSMPVAFLPCYCHFGIDKSVSATVERGKREFFHTFYCDVDLHFPTVFEFLPMTLRCRSHFGFDILEHSVFHLKVYPPPVFYSQSISSVHIAQNRLEAGKLEETRGRYKPTGVVLFAPKFYIYGWDHILPGESMQIVKACFLIDKPLYVVYETILRVREQELGSVFADFPVADDISQNPSHTSSLKIPTVSVEEFEKAGTVLRASNVFTERNVDSAVSGTASITCEFQEAVSPRLTYVWFQFGENLVSSYRSLRISPLPDAAHTEDFLCAEQEPCVVSIVSKPNIETKFCKESIYSCLYIQEESYIVGEARVINDTMLLCESEGLAPGKRVSNSVIELLVYFGPPVYTESNPNLLLQHQVTVLPILQLERVIPPILALFPEVDIFLETQMLGGWENGEVVEQGVGCRFRSKTGKSVTTLVKVVGSQILCVNGYAKLLTFLFSFDSFQPTQNLGDEYEDLFVDLITLTAYPSLLSTTKQLPVVQHPVLAQVEPAFAYVNSLTENRFSLVGDQDNFVVTGIGLLPTSCCRFTISNRPEGSYQGEIHREVTKAFYLSKTQVECERPVFKNIGATVTLEISPNCDQFLLDLNASDEDLNLLSPNLPSPNIFSRSVKSNYDGFQNPSQIYDVHQLKNQFLKQSVLELEVMQPPFLDQIYPQVIVSVSKGATLHVIGKALDTLGIRLKVAGKLFTGVRIYNTTYATAILPESPVTDPQLAQASYPLEVSFDYGVYFYQTRFQIIFQQTHAIWNIRPRIGVYGYDEFKLTLDGYFNFKTLTTFDASQTVTVSPLFLLKGAALRLHWPPQGVL